MTARLPILYVDGKRVHFAATKLVRPSNEPRGAA